MILVTNKTKIQAKGGERGYDASESGESQQDITEVCFRNFRADDTYPIQAVQAGVIDGYDDNKTI